MKHKYKIGDIFIGNKKKNPLTIISLTEWGIQPAYLCKKENKRVHSYESALKEFIYAEFELSIHFTKKNNYSKIWRNICLKTS